MSQNTDAKDKITIDPTAAPGEPKGKINIDPTDSEGLMEHFSKLNPGDEVSGKFKATLDEAGQKTVVLSISEISVDAPDADAEPAAEDAAEGEEGEEAEGEPASVTMMKNEEGVPSGEDNNPPDEMPTH